MKSAKIGEVLKEWSFIHT